MEHPQQLAASSCTGLCSVHHVSEVLEAHRNYLARQMQASVGMADVAEEQMSAVVACSYCRTKCCC